MVLQHGQYRKVSQVLITSLLVVAELVVPLLQVRQLAAAVAGR
jgi:hypothetical protein